MADVSRRGASRCDRPHSETRGRGQLIIVTALSLAILFVTLALILNTAIYTENLATRSGDIGGATDAVRYHDAARDGVGGVIGYANANNNTSHSTLQSNLSTGVADFRNNSARLFASGDRAVEVTLDDSVNGTRIAQNDENRNFTNVSGTEAPWIVASDVNHVRAFEMHVYRDELLGVLSDAFVVTLDDGTTEWNITVRKVLTDDIEIVIDGPTASDSCTVDANDAWINVSEETFGGEQCAVLGTMADGLTPPYEVRFENPSKVRGSYTFIVDNSTLADSPGPHLVTDGAGQPFAAHAIYSANVTVVYETSRLYYNTTVRVAPGEPDG